MSTILTEVRDGATVPALLSVQAPYLVRMIKPNLIVSHDWHVQPICQRSITAGSPERGRGSRFRRLIRCPRTCFALETGALLTAPAFLREPFKHIEDLFVGQAIIVLLSLIPALRSTPGRPEALSARTAQKISKINQHTRA